MSLVFIGLGSNLGPGRQHIQLAWHKLGQQKSTLALALSSPYLTEPVGMASEQLFTNAVGVLETSLSPQDLLKQMLAIELEMGRNRGQGKDRQVDLDILYYDDQLINEPELLIPHPEIAARLFVLAPLAKVAPDHLHPGTGQSSGAMKRLLASGQGAKKISWE